MKKEIFFYIMVICQIILSVLKTIQKIKPDEIYNLGAQSRWGFF